jgi:hypothetical protein
MLVSGWSIVRTKFHKNRALRLCVVGSKEGGTVSNIKELKADGVL